MIFKMTLHESDSHVRNQGHSESYQTETCFENAQLNDCGFE